MRKHLLFSIGIATMLSSCVTRYEYDTYTITVRDSVYREHIRNTPGSNGDNGTVFPSSRTTKLSRESLSYDSTYERQYPLFLRYGGIEVASFVTGSSNTGRGPGIFGAYTVLDSNRIDNLVPDSLQKILGIKKENNFFKGHLFRILPVEYQLHWFNEAPNWTIGWNAYESIAQDNDSTNTLKSTGANIYIRKRYWFRDKPPYVFASPFFYETPNQNPPEPKSNRCDKYNYNNCACTAGRFTKRIYFYASSKSKLFNFFLRCN